jgi:hypothetical protein
MKGELAVDRNSLSKEEKKLAWKAIGSSNTRYNEELEKGHRPTDTEFRAIIYKESEKVLGR